MKKCSKCFIEKEISEFHKDSSRINGYSYVCKMCRYKKTAETKEIRSIKSKKRYNDNKKELLKKQSNYYYDNRDERLEYQNNWYKNADKQILNATKRKYNKNKRKNDPEFKLQMLLRQRLKNVLKGRSAPGHFIRDLGCSITELKTYLEKQFKPGMTWENNTIKGWHIDHIRPLVTFNLQNREEFLKACHYTNLQPLWAKENLRKSKTWKK